MKIDHIGIAVRSLEESSAKWAEFFGLRIHEPEEIRERGVRLVHLGLKEGASIELIAPCGEESPVEKFLKERGEGIHHFCFEVDDIEKAIEELKDRGINFIHDKPQKGAEGSLIAFIHPRNFNGVLIELKEKK